ncbi:hypothetical protein [Pontibacter populi]|uniref:Lipoprotein n=1 Tax=Pontibacter populi TaxID=890055 RepID=A0ABV1RT51_9BACT
MKFEFVAIFLVLMLLSSCSQSIEYDNIQNKDGLYFDKSTGKFLDGKFESVTLRPYSRETVIKQEFKNGLPTGEWEEWNGDELIHHGEYIQENDLAIRIKKMTNSKRVNLNLWKEADFAMLSIELVQPAHADSSTLEKVAIVTEKEFKDKYVFSTIIFDSINNSTTERRIFEYEIR